MSEELLEIELKLPVRIAKGFPIPYHGLVDESQASDVGDTARVGLGMNFAVLYVWINDVMHCVRMEDLVNALIPELLPVRVKLTKKGREALRAYEAKKGGAS